MIGGTTISIIAFIRAIMTRRIGNYKRKEHKDENSSKDNFRTIGGLQHVGGMST
jgi:hypothetical protein